MSGRIWVIRPSTRRSSPSPWRSRSDRLQQVFQANDENIAEWIWQRRLEVAASRLYDPGSVGFSLGALAYTCGFVSQSHFSRRFKDRYGMPPSEYRAGAIKIR